MSARYDCKEPAGAFKDHRDERKHRWDDSDTPKKETTSVKTDDDVDLVDACGGHGDVVDVVHEVGEEHLKVSGRPEEGEEVDEGDSRDGEVG